MTEQPPEPTEKLAAALARLSLRAAVPGVLLVALGSMVADQGWFWPSAILLGLAGFLALAAAAAAGLSLVYLEDRLDRLTAGAAGIIALATLIAESWLLLG